MSSIALRVEGLGKEYRIGGRVAKYKTLRESLASLASGGGSLDKPHEKADERIWALRDVTFEIRQGEVVGVIGRNGAGKSTLLKVLARITEPTCGVAQIHGRVGSLLEVGTGFHPELTGRENIYLNGAILGMRRSEINRKFDQIVAFSEIEQFIDTPVKRYSSGMYLRLAFAVAAHLEPEILLVDEVLAVGDAEFQQKCLGRMGDIASEGRTVLFVSHNMSAVQALCPRAILLRQASIAHDGPTTAVLREYLGYLHATASDAFQHNPERRGTGGLRLTGARIVDGQGRSIVRLIAGEPVTLEFSYENRINASRADFNVTVYNHLGTAAFHLSTGVAGARLTNLEERGVVDCHIPRLPLPNGEYRVAVAVRCQGLQTDLIPNALVFSVDSSVFFPTGKSPDIERSACLVSHEWRHRSPNREGAYGGAKVAEGG